VAARPGSRSVMTGVVVGCVGVCVGWGVNAPCNNLQVLVKQLSSRVDINGHTLHL